jgi:hypothetical protein
MGTVSQDFAIFDMRGMKIANGCYPTVNKPKRLPSVMGAP